jgi:hypothetical protein
VISSAIQILIQICLTTWLNQFLNMNANSFQKI